MGIAALVAWILTAGGGFYLLTRWVAGGGHRQSSPTRFPPALIFGHFLLAAAGLVLWIIALVLHSAPLGWIALAVLAAVAILGSTMLGRWIPTYQSSRVPMSAGQPPAGASADAPPERSFPVAVVAAHGVLAVTTVILVVLTDLHVGNG